MPNGMNSRCSLLKRPGPLAVVGERETLDDSQLRHFSATFFITKRDS
jgi:hypothetical protein